MRCNNCGWDNNPGTSNCIKCGHSLQVENSYASQSYTAPALQPAYGSESAPRPTVLNATGMQEPAPRPTVIGASPMQDPTPRPTRVVNSVTPSGVSQQPQGSRNCAHCGYPVVGDFTSCPNCGAPMAPAPQPIVPSPSPIRQAASDSGLVIDEHVKCVKCGAEVSIDFAFCPKCGERIHMPTVRAIRHKADPPKPKCTLELLLEEDEVTQPRTNEYEGAFIILNRDNSEPDNRTITSKEQAELTCEDGKWYVLNKSELGSTYIECNRKIEILSGDVIVMGDRRFKFEPK